MVIYGMSDRAILRELGSRLKRRRLDKNWSQQRLAERAGLNRTTVGEMERGAPFSMLTLIQILRALNALDVLDSFLPEPGLSPLQMARMKGKQRRRASRQKPEDDEGAFDW